MISHLVLCQTAYFFAQQIPGYIVYLIVIQPAAQQIHNMSAQENADVPAMEGVEDLTKAPAAPAAPDAAATVAADAAVDAATGEEKGEKHGDEEVHIFKYQKHMI